MNLTARKQIQILKTLLEADAEKNFQLTASQLGATTRELEKFERTAKAGKCLHIYPQGRKTFYRLSNNTRTLAEKYLAELTAVSNVSLAERLRVLESLGMKLPAGVVHSRVVAALLQENSKAKLSSETLTFLEQNGLQVQHNSLLRIRSQAPLKLHFTCGRVEEIAPEESLNKELFLSDLALSQITNISSGLNIELRLITIENHAAYCHFSLESDELAVFQPGFDDRQIKILLEKLTFSCRSHFGDLDQQGIEIALRHIPLHSTPVEFLLPEQELLVELLSHFALPITDEREGEWMRKNWRPEVFPDNLQRYLAPLITNKKWLEQEVMTLLPRQKLIFFRLP
ncbi:DUF2220 family protein [Rheinheimera muenzenbergensis]|uniref:DUF2220 family protein n=1 Tax=Rheinheimera muenzenbergensis TaxID=1193628 RepID=A0ABU8C8T5_9GAMM